MQSLRLILQEPEDFVALSAFGVLAFSDSFGEGKIFEDFGENLAQ